MTQPSSPTRPRNPKVIAGILVALVLCGVAVLCLAGAGGAVLYFRQATALAGATQTALVVQQAVTATALAAASAAQAQTQAAATGTAVARSAAATSTAQALAVAATATVQAKHQASTATAQARAEASTATALAAASTAQAQPANATPTVALPAAVAQDWPVIVMDPFDSNAQNWPTGDYTDDYGSGSRTIAGGKYTWTAASKQGRLWRVNYEGESAADCYLAADVRVVTGDDSTRYGLVLRDDGQNYYFFDVGKDGRFAFYLWSGGKWTTLVDLTPSNLIQAGGVNRLAALVQGKQFTLYINDQRVTRIQDSTLREGLTGLAINLNSQTAQAELDFDNFELRVP